MNYLIYTTIADQAKAIPKLKELRQGKDKASARVVNFWYGEIERNYEVVFVADGCEKVSEAYRNAGIEVRDLFEAPKKVGVVKEPVVVPQEVVAELVQEPVEAKQDSDPVIRRGRHRKGE